MASGRRGRGPGRETHRRRQRMRLACCQRSIGPSGATCSVLPFNMVLVRGQVVKTGRTSHKAAAPAATMRAQRASELAGASPGPVPWWRAIIGSCQHSAGRQWHAEKGLVRAALASACYVGVLYAPTPKLLLQAPPSACHIRGKTHRAAHRRASRVAAMIWRRLTRIVLASRVGH